MRYDFDTINSAAKPVLLAILRRILPGGKVVGPEYISRNPTRWDKHPGSFKVNLRTGRWADFATDDKGGDVVSLVAFLQGVTQAKALRLVAGLLGLTGGDNGR